MFNMASIQDRLKTIAIKHKSMFIFCSIIILLVVAKIAWVFFAMRGQGSMEKEKSQILCRANYLVSKVATSPEQLFNEMPSSIGEQFQGEWALYSCSMTVAGLVNIALQFPEEKDSCIKHIDQIIEIALSEKIREYDTQRWGEDPLESLDGERSHISYLSHLAWMISGYKQISTDNKYDTLYHSLCETMNRRIQQSEMLNLPTYPGEPIYVPDMLVAIVALANYSRQNNGRYSQIVNQWIERAQKEWLDKKTGLLVSYLPNDSSMSVKGSYSSLNCYYLTFIDKTFAEDQYKKLKAAFLQSSPLTGIKEYYDKTCWFGFDMDAGPILFNLSPSGTAFVVGSATFFMDKSVRSGVLRTAEIAGSTVTWNGKSHYLLANVALVGEAIMLAMRTTIEWK